MHFTRTIATGVLAISMFSTPAKADIAARYESIEDKPIMRMEMTVEADDAGNVRMQMARLGSYYLLLDGELYQVANSSAGPFVARVSDLMIIQAEFAEDFFQDAPPEADFPKQSFAPMAEETVGGRKGIGYGMVSEQNPTPMRASLVISEDPELMPLGQAIVATNEAMAKGIASWGQMGTMLGSMNAEMLSVLEQGAPLRMLSLALTDISTDDIPGERFELPANPLTIEELRTQILPQVEAPPTLPPHED